MANVKRIVRYLLSTPSLGITRVIVDLRFGHKRLAFNSLSRDHLTAVTDGSRFVKPSFNSLSRDHEAIDELVRRRLYPNLSTPSLGITSLAHLSPDLIERTFNSLSRDHRRRK